MKDEYEVALLYADPAFRASMAAQFEGAAGTDYSVKFNLAPPVLSSGDKPRKRVFGQWLWPVLSGLARFRSLRGGFFDVFGRTLERRMERQLAHDYEITISRAFALGSSADLDDVRALAALFERVRGYGHVKLAQLAAVKRAEHTIVARMGIEGFTSDAVQEAIDAARIGAGGSLKGIPVVVVRE